MTSGDRRLVIIGCGFVGEALARHVVAEGKREVHVTTRQRSRVPFLEALGAAVTVVDDGDGFARVAAEAEGGDCVVTFPPHPEADRLAAAAVRRSAASVYVSSTAVYGAAEGRIDDATEAAGDDDRARRRLLAEGVYQAEGAVVLRAPAIYGPGRGVHRRLQAGTLSLTDGGTRFISRIHVDDLVGLILAGLRRGEPGKAHVIGDHRPSPQRELVAYLCAKLGLPMPGSIPSEAAHATLRGNRRVDPRPALAALNYTLRFPDSRSGYDQVLAAEA